MIYTRYFNLQCIRRYIGSLVTKKDMRACMRAWVLMYVCDRVVQIVYAATFSISVMDEPCLPFSPVLCQLSSIVAVDYPFLCTPSRLQSWRADRKIDDDRGLASTMSDAKWYWGNFRDILSANEWKDWIEKKFNNELTARNLHIFLIFALLKIEL